MRPAELPLGIDLGGSAGMRRAVGALAAAVLVAGLAGTVFSLATDAPPHAGPGLEPDKVLAARAVPRRRLPAV